MLRAEELLGLGGGSIGGDVTGAVDLGEVCDVVAMVAWLARRNEASVVGVVAASVGRLEGLVGSTTVEVGGVVSLTGGALAQVGGNLRSGDGIWLRVCTGVAGRRERDLLRLL